MDGESTDSFLLALVTVPSGLRELGGGGRARRVRSAGCSEVRVMRAWWHALGVVEASEASLRRRKTSGAKFNAGAVQCCAVEAKRCTSVSAVSQRRVFARMGASCNTAHSGATTGASPSIPRYTPLLLLAGWSMRMRIRLLDLARTVKLPWPALCEPWSPLLKGGRRGMKGRLGTIVSNNPTNTCSCFLLARPGPCSLQPSFCAPAASKTSRPR